jgi:branched-chain amino acid transport system ATP-binding protein
VCDHDSKAKRACGEVKKVIDGDFCLKLNGVTKSFMGVVAVNDVTFHVEDKEILGLIGPNGAGKTTLFNVITKIYSLDKGKMFFKGQDITQMKDYKINRLGIARTFQNLRLLKELSVLDNVLTASSPRVKTTKLDCVLNLPYFRIEEKTFRKRAYELLERGGLADKATFEAGSLAYADQRHLEIARALATNPTLLLLDEPTAGMNATEALQLKEYLLAIHQQGITLLIIGHDMRFIMGLCQRIVVLNYGKIIATGKPRDIQRNEDVLKAYLGGVHDVASY